MGSVEPYETAAGRRYRVRYRDPDRRSREKAGFTTKRAAEEYLAGVTVSAARGEYVDPRTAKVTIGELGTVWLANQTHLKPSALRPVEIAWRVHVEPVWGARRIGDVNHSDVQAWITRLTVGRSATTVTRAFGVLAAILDVAVRDRRISTNPARGVKLPRKGRKHRAYLTGAQVRLLASCTPDHGTLVLFLAFTGLRWGEATALRISAVDTLRRRVLVQENAVKVGQQVIVGTPKTHETRSVPYPKFLSEPIAAACEGKTREQLVFGNGTTHLRTPHSVGGWFVRAVQRAQQLDPDFPTVTIHDLRHTAASLAISAGANPKAVQRMLGHASAAMTLDTYADLFEDDLDDVSARLDSAHAPAVVGDLWGIDARQTKKAP